MIRRTAIILLLSSLLAHGLLLLLGYNPLRPWLAGPKNEIRELVDRFGPGPLRNLLNGGALDPLEVEQLLLSSDPYSDYLDSREYEDFERDAYQRYVGIGIEIQRMNDRVTVLRVFEEGPAAEAGLLPGDQFLRVEGADVTSFGVSEVVERLRGRSGSPVQLQVWRPEERTEKTFRVIRREVFFDSVRDARILESGIGYVRITQFGARTGEEFIEALETLEAEQMNQGLIIDLRSNPGGMLSAAVDVAEIFLERGELVVSIKGVGNARSQDQVFRSRTPRRPVDYPVAILINRASASASEIVAGALQDHGQAVVLGERSHGKGSVQSVFALRDGTGLRMTTAMYYLPLGETIEQQGVRPDQTVHLPMEDRYKLFLQLRHLPVLGPEGFERQFGFAPIEDLVLSAALERLR